MRTVRNPPRLIPQQTGAWCFAACESMVRSYYQLPGRSQYQIARAYTAERANVEPDLNLRWQMAWATDQGPPVQHEQNGDNPNSQIVALVRSEWGVVDADATNGRYIAALDEAVVRREIDADRILVIGNPIHYYAVFGYEGTGPKFTMLVLDPWPVGNGGAVDQVSMTEYRGWQGPVAILFATP